MIAQKNDRVISPQAKHGQHITTPQMMLCILYSKKFNSSSDERKDTICQLK